MPHEADRTRNWAKQPSRTPPPPHRFICEHSSGTRLRPNRSSSVLWIDKGFVIILQSFKRTKQWQMLKLIVCGFEATGMCVCVRRSLCYLQGENRERPKKSTLISSTYGWVSHISLIRFIGISLSPKIVRVWKNGCLEGPLISEPSALLTQQADTEELRPFLCLAQKKNQ